MIRVLPTVIYQGAGVVHVDLEPVGQAIAIIVCLCDIEPQFTVPILLPNAVVINTTQSAISAGVLEIVITPPDSCRDAVGQFRGTSLSKVPIIWADIAEAINLWIFIPQFNRDIDELLVLRDDSCYRKIRVLHISRIRPDVTGKCQVIDFCFDIKIRVRKKVYLF